MDKYVIAQFIGLIAILFWVISIHRKEQYKILFLQVLANLSYTIQYFILGVFSASSMNLSSTIRCYVFYRKRKKQEEISKFWLIIFIFLILLLGILTYKDYLSLIPITITLFYTISSWMEDSKWIRIVFLLAAFVWIFYNYIVGAYISIFGNIFEIISGITALIRFSKKREKEL